LGENIPNQKSVQSNQNQSFVRIPSLMTFISFHKR